MKSNRIPFLMTWTRPPYHGIDMPKWVRLKQPVSRGVHVIRTEGRRGTEAQTGTRFVAYRRRANLYCQPALGSGLSELA